MNKVLRILSLIFLAGMTCIGCDSANDIEDAIDTGLNPPSRKRIDVSRTGVQNFFLSQNVFGSVSAQFRDIQRLHLHYVRILVAWTDGTQPSPSAPLNLGFTDQILSNIPAGVDVLVTLAHTPSWFTNPVNWKGKNAREAYVEQFVRPIVNRYKGRRGIIGWEIFNEPNDISVASDASLELIQPANYLELLRLSFQSIRQIDPGKLVVMAASLPINQDWDDNISYNRALRDLGATNFTDVWNIHYYGKQYERVGQIAGFLNSLGKPIWISESGVQGPNNQLAYVEEVWPFLDENIQNIDRFYYYQYSSTDPVNSNYGLRTNDPNFPVSDLYIYLRDAAQ